VFSFENHFISFYVFFWDGAYLEFNTNGVFYGLCTFHFRFGMSTFMHWSQVRVLREENGVSIHSIYRLTPTVNVLDTCICTLSAKPLPSEAQCNHEGGERYS